MSVFAIGDLHLSFASPKLMDVFGPEWEGHAPKLEANWRETVSGDDLVLIPGDLSWAMHLEDAKADLDWLARLPGKKVLLRGNHDYWWDSISKIRRMLTGTGIYVLQNDCVFLDGTCVAGTRLWKAPGFKLRSFPLRPQTVTAMEVVKERKTSPEDDERIWRRELGRLRLSLSAMPRAFARRSAPSPQRLWRVGDFGPRGRDCDVAIAMTHFPPVNPDGEGTEAAEMIERAGITQCVFGHMHNIDKALLPSFDVTRGGTRYRLVSADYLDFRPLKIA